jgi:hypothetical protein
VRFLVPISDQRITRPSAHLAWIAKRVAQTVVDINRLYIRTHRVPPLYESGVLYQEEPLGQGYEEFAPIPNVLMRGWGDCDDLVPWRVAELQECGEPATIRLEWTVAKRGPHAGKKLFHLLVRRARLSPGGVWVESDDTECPSTKLGMGINPRKVA